MNVRCTYGIFGREITYNVVKCGAIVWLWPTLRVMHVRKNINTLTQNCREERYSRLPWPFTPPILSHKLTQTLLIHTLSTNTPSTYTGTKLQGRARQSAPLALHGATLITQTDTNTPDPHTDTNTPDPHTEHKHS